MNVGDKVPLIQFKATNGINTNLDQFHGQWLILYFYPKDATPGCTTQACDFRDNDKEFAFLNAIVLGVSRDKLTSHEKFKASKNLPFELISDPEEMLCESFDVIRMKSMYGKQVRGIERSTFIIDPKGILQHEWRKVTVDGHIEEVLVVLQSLQRVYPHL
ncbi:MAG: peroxiredoxin [Legionella sp.]|nr:peroxiredoxin [Legionella sp.]